MAAGMKILYLHEFPDPTPDDYDTDAILELSSELMGGFDNDPVPGAEMLNQEAARFYARNSGSKAIETIVGKGSGYDSIKSLKELVRSDYVKNEYAGSREDFLRDTRPGEAERKELPDEERFTGDRLMHALRFSDEYADNLEFYSRMATAVESSLVTELSETRETSAMFSNTACKSLETTYDSIEEQSKELNDAIKQLLSLRKSKAPGATGEVEEKYRNERNALLELVDNLLRNVNSETSFDSGKTLDVMSRYRLVVPSSDTKRPGFVWRESAQQNLGNVPPRPFDIYSPSEAAKRTSGNYETFSSLDKLSITPSDDNESINQRALADAEYFLRVLSGEEGNVGMLPSLMKERTATNTYYSDLINTIQSNLKTAIDSTLRPFKIETLKTFESEEFSDAAFASRSLVNTEKGIVPSSYYKSYIDRYNLPLIPSDSEAASSLSALTAAYESIDPGSFTFITDMTGWLEMFSNMAATFAVYRNAVLYSSTSQFNLIEKKVVERFNALFSSKTARRQDITDILIRLNNRIADEGMKEQPQSVKEYLEYVGSKPMSSYRRRTKEEKYFLPEITPEILNVTADNWDVIIDALAYSPGSISLQSSSDWNDIADRYLEYLSNIAKDTRASLDPSNMNTGLVVIKENVKKAAYSSDSRDYVKNEKITVKFLDSSNKKQTATLEDVRPVITSSESAMTKANVTRGYIDALEYTIIIMGDVFNEVVSKRFYLKGPEGKEEKMITESLSEARSIDDAIRIINENELGEVTEKQLTPVIMRIIKKRLMDYYLGNMETIQIDTDFYNPKKYFSGQVIPLFAGKLGEPFSLNYPYQNKVIKFGDWENTINFDAGVDLIKNHLKTIYEDRLWVIEAAKTNRDSFNAIKEQKDENDAYCKAVITNNQQTIFNLEQQLTQCSSVVDFLNMRITQLTAEFGLEPESQKGEKKRKKRKTDEPITAEKKLFDLKKKYDDQITKLQNEKFSLQQKQSNLLNELTQANLDLTNAKNALMLLNQGLKEGTVTPETAKKESSEEALKAEITILENKLTLQHQSAVNAATKKKEAEREAKEAKEKLKEIKKTLDEQQKRITRITKDLDNNLAALSKCTAEKTTLENRISALNEEKKIELEQEKQKTKNLKDRLELEEKDTQKAQQATKQAKKDLKQAQTDLKQAQTTIRQNSTLITQQSNRLSQCTIKINDLQERLNQKMSATEEKRLRDEKEKLENQVSQMEQNIATLQKQVESAEEVKDQAVKKIRKDLQDKIGTLEREKTNISSELKRKTTEDAEKKKQLTQLQETLKKKDTEITDKSKIISNLREKLVKGEQTGEGFAAKEVTRLKKLLREATKERDACLTEKEALEERIKVLNSDLEVAKEANKNYLNNIEDLKTLLQFFPPIGGEGEGGGKETSLDVFGSYPPLPSSPLPRGFKGEEGPSGEKGKEPEKEAEMSPDVFGSLPTRGKRGEISPEEKEAETLEQQEGRQEKKPKIVKRVSRGKTRTPPEPAERLSKRTRSVERSGTLRGQEEPEEGPSEPTEVSPFSVEIRETPQFSSSGSSTQEGSESDEREYRRVTETPNQGDLPPSFFGGVPEMERSFAITSKQSDRKKNTITKAMRNLFL